MASRMRPVIRPDAHVLVGVDWGLHPDEYVERLDFYDQPCMYAESD